VVHDPWEDGDKHVDVEEIRTRIRKLSDAELIREGRAAHQLVSPWNGKPPRKMLLGGRRESLGQISRNFASVPGDMLLVN
jgi:hypothetical protein